MGMTLLLGSLAAFLTGLSKGGLKGWGVVIVSITMIAYGAKASTGLLVPLFIIGDVLGVIYFKKYAKKENLIQFLPAMLIGIVVAVFVGEGWDEALFKKWMSGFILFATIYMFWSEFRPTKISAADWRMAQPLGFVAGFTTMLGNLAGPFANLYLLAKRIPKHEIMATSAWIFIIVNNFKIPFHIWVWETISWETLKIDLYLAPMVVIGFFIGTRALNWFSEQYYRYFLLAVTAIGAVVAIFG